MKLKCNYPNCTFEVNDKEGFDVYYEMARHWDSHMDFDVLDEQGATS